MSPEDPEIIKSIIMECLSQTKSQFQNEVEITNANSKGVKQITIKGRSDKPLEELLREVNKQYEGILKDVKE